MHIRTICIDLYLIGLFALVAWEYVDAVIDAVKEFADDVASEIHWIKQQSSWLFLLVVLGYPAIIVLVALERLGGLNARIVEKFKKKAPSAT